MKQYLSIGQAAEYLGISEQTLRRWDADGSFKASFVSPGGHRFYSLADLAKQTKGIYQIAKEWAMSAEATEPLETFYCSSIEKFKTRLERMAREMEGREALRDIGPVVASVAGEIGNNSFDHNIGNWPDVPGAFFAYDLGKRTIALADRGRGVLSTLRATKPDLGDDASALRVAFTEVVTGRAPEHRGNGLKYVRKAVTRFKLRLLFQSGDSEVELKDGNDAIDPAQSANRVRGSLTLLEF
jgi:excisionase family DNA binding protein